MKVVGLEVVEFTDFLRLRQAALEGCLLKSQRDQCFGGS